MKALDAVTGLTMILISTSLLGCGKSNGTEGNSPSSPTPDPVTSAMPPLEVSDNFLLSDLKDTEFASLTFGREINVPKWTFSLERYESGPGGGSVSAKLNAIYIYDGNYYQSALDGSADYVDLVSGKKVSEGEFNKVRLNSQCSGWWTPIRPDKTVLGAQTGYWSIKADTVLPLKRITQAKAEAGSIIFVHSDTYMWANQLNLECMGVLENQLSLGHLKKMLGSAAVLRIQK